MKVRELIAELSELDLDCEVVIQDADTGWWLRLTAAFQSEEKGVKYVVVAGGYGDQVTGN